MNLIQEASTSVAIALAILISTARKGWLVDSQLEWPLRLRRWDGIAGTPTGPL